ncbi:MAG: hypothetical protein HZA61_03200 [Candidatus Eisenbacteria bacterium]|uniref:Uncharacterized protein n=1 Tax=Eiseniibacteriota bacterium TaxID=2212470 RepID=A0A933SEE9_UNCEI|nr:hypothetical protein [Candidatus Eisenbacteria bacterium]
MAGWISLVMGLMLRRAGLTPTQFYEVLIAGAFLLSIFAMLRKRIAAGLLLLCATMFLPLFVDTFDAGSPAGVTAARSSSSPSSNTSAVTPPASTPSVPVEGTQWAYQSDEDPMSGSRAYRAYVSSTNTVDFDFPYAGEQHATLFLRTHPRYGKDVILQIERGQFLVRSYEASNVLVRFDEDPPLTFSAIGPADNGTETIFIQNYPRFVSRMMKAKRVRIAAPVYKEGSPVFEFDVRGFSVERYKPASPPASGSK